MPNSPTIQVQDLIPKNLARLPDTLKDELANGSLSTLPSHLVGRASSCIAGQIHEALHIDVLDWLGRAWACARELQKFKAAEVPSDAAAKAKTASRSKAVTEEHRVTLGQHHLSCVSHPVLTLTFGTHKVRIDRFAIELEAKLTQASLVIVDGYITALEGGSGTASALLKFSDHALHDPLEPEPIRIPINYKFDKPGHKIAIL